MPIPGVPNNPGGINGYEDQEKEKILTRAVPVVSPPGIGAPRRAQRRAVRGRGGGATLPASPPQLHPDAVTAATGASQSILFWQSVLDDPGASPLARETAQRALGG